MDLNIVLQICTILVPSFRKTNDGLMYRQQPDAGVDLTNLTWGNFFSKNLLPVTLGNIVGGAFALDVRTGLSTCAKQKKLHKEKIVSVMYEMHK